MIFKEIAFGSDDYQHAFSLRDALLRAPLGLSLKDGDLSKENKYLHFGLFNAESNELLACAVIVPQPPTKAELYQIAVNPLQQKKGIGKKMMQAIEEQLQIRGINYLEMDARASVAEFYKKLDYSIVGDTYMKLTPTLAHVKMVKNI
jgi:ribosomal protein S18 acetylase RimI-like enzyme